MIAAHTDKSKGEHWIPKCLNDFSCIVLPVWTESSVIMRSCWHSSSSHHGISLHQPHTWSVEVNDAEVPQWKSSWRMDGSHWDSEAYWSQALIINASDLCLTNNPFPCFFQMSRHIFICITVAGDVSPRRRSNEPVCSDWKMHVHLEMKHCYHQAPLSPGAAGICISLTLQGLRLLCLSSSVAAAAGSHVFTLLEVERGADGSSLGSGGRNHYPNDSNNLIRKNHWQT